jgi:hypothetical protein
MHELFDSIESRLSPSDDKYQRIAAVSCGSAKLIERVSDECTRRSNIYKRYDIHQDELLSNSLLK